MKQYTEDDVVSCWAYYLPYLVQILNGEYSVESAREDLSSLIGSRWDPRVSEANTENNT